MKQELKILTVASVLLYVVLPIIIILSLLGCGQPKEPKVIVEKPDPTVVEVTERTSGKCSVKEVDDGALVSCEDGSAVLIPRAKDGRDGNPGQDGSTISPEDGDNGRDGKDGADGLDGKDGVDGKDGAPGKDGRSNQDLIEFIHPITEKRFILTHQTSGNSINTNGYSCPTGSSEPTDPEDLLLAGLSTYYMLKNTSITKLIVGFDTATGEVKLLDKESLTKASSGSEFNNKYHKVCEVD